MDHGAAAAAAKEVEEETTLLNEFKDKIRELRRVVEREDEEDFAQVQSLIGSMPFSQKILSDIEESNLDPDLGAAGQMNESQKKAFYETANAFIAVAKDLFNLKKEALRETKKVLDKDTKLAKKTATGRLTEAEKEGLKAFAPPRCQRLWRVIDSALGYVNKGLGGAREYTEENKVKQDLKTARIELKRKKRENVNARKRKIEREKAQKKNQSRDGFGLSLEFTEGDKVKSNDSGDIKTYTVEYEDEGKTAKEQWPLVNLIPRDEDPRFDFDMTYKPIFKGFAKELKQSFENRSSTTPTTVKFSLQGTEKIKKNSKPFRRITIHYE